MSTHAFLAPSGAFCTVKCAAAPAMQQRCPEQETDAQREGTAAHWAAAEVLAGRPVDVGVIAPNGVILTAEMCEGAEMYADDVTQAVTPWCVANNTAPDGRLYVETPISCATLHPHCWGTPDTWFWEPRLLRIWDFKFGHALVEAFENWQLLSYAAGILDALNGLEDQQTIVEFRIVQPRAFHIDGPIRVWRAYASDLRGYFNILRHAFAEAMKPDAAAKPGPHCKYCTGAPICTALQRESYRITDATFAAQPFDMPPGALGVELRIFEDALTMLTARVEGLREQAFAMLKRGNSVPFYAVEFGKGRERWAKPSREVVALGELMGVNLAKPPEVITPNQARKAGVPAAVVAAYTEVPTGSQKLVRDDGTKARKIFGAKP